MSSPVSDPLTLRLPSWLCESFDLARAIANDHRSLGRTTGVCRFGDLAPGAAQALRAPQIANLFASPASV